MELGRLAEMEQAQVNHVEKVEKVQKLDDNNRVNSNEQYKNAAPQPENAAPQNEVILDNVRFGYNQSSQDFFVKVTRGDAEYKFPTDEMMRIKAQMLVEAMNAAKS
eukprot:Anaeramoba_flamelloidesa350093_59.p1 GENE.a350093_59~~a350093_59.p1  ORF type:complete len:106 (+),score=12.62 a350093_59:42-359(+)